MKRPANEAKVLERHPRLARDLPRHHDPLELRRRLPRRDRGGFPVPARLARGSPARPRRRVPLRAGRGRRRQRPARPGARRGQGRALRPDHGADRADQRREARRQGRQDHRRADRRASMSEGGATGRSKADAPEIDGEVYLRDAGELKPGDIVRSPGRGRRRARPVRRPRLTAVACRSPFRRDHPRRRRGGADVRRARRAARAPRPAGRSFARAGRKILISGGGRCNFTNIDAAPDRFLSANPHFAKSALGRYTPADFIALVERHGIAWHEKTLGQLFCDGSARQIVDMLLDECAAGGVEIALRRGGRRRRACDGALPRRLRRATAPRRRRW